MSTRREVVLLAANRTPRALLRAQLTEEGLEVIALDAWAAMRECLLATPPRCAIVDLQDLERPDAVLEHLRGLIDPDRVLVLTAAGTVPAETVERLGFRVLSRPVRIADVVKAVTAA